MKRTADGENKESRRAWLLTALTSEERLYQGHDGYADEIRSEYQYDSFVPNHRQVSEGDIALIRGKDIVHGTAVVTEVSARPGEKTRRLCPDCGSSKLKERKVKRPRIRCECGSEFQTAVEQIVPCTIYLASFGDTFRDLLEEVRVEDLWRLAPRLNKQHAMLELNREQLCELIPAVCAKSEALGQFSDLPAQSFTEGELKWVLMQRVERSPSARSACIAHYGPHCFGCGISLETLYGEVGRGVIDVHHLEPIASSAEPHKVDPVRDLRPLCPNCHRIVHTRKPPLSMQELKELMRHPRLQLDEERPE